MPKNQHALIGLVIVNVLVLVFSVIAQSDTQALNTDEHDWRIGSIEVDNVITVISSILATLLFIISFIAYKRDGRKKFFYVSVAFGLFAIKGYLIASDIFFPYKGGWVDPLANILDFAILMCFFFGMIKK